MLLILQMELRHKQFSDSPVAIYQVQSQASYAVWIQEAFC